MERPGRVVMPAVWEVSIVCNGHIQLKPPNLPAYPHPQALRIPTQSLWINLASHLSHFTQTAAFWILLTAGRVRVANAKH